MVIPIKKPATAQFPVRWRAFSGSHLHGRIGFVVGFDDGAQHRRRYEPPRDSGRHNSLRESHHEKQIRTRSKATRHSTGTRATQRISNPMDEHSRHRHQNRLFTRNPAQLN